MRDVTQNKVLLSTGHRYTCILCAETDAQSRERLFPWGSFIICPSSYTLPLFLSALGLAMAICAFLTLKQNGLTFAFSQQTQSGLFIELHPWVQGHGINLPKGVKVKNHLEVSSSVATHCIPFQSGQPPSHSQNWKVADLTLECYVC